jgi:hypothetical protein
MDKVSNLGSMVDLVALLVDFDCNIYWMQELQSTAQLNLKSQTTCSFKKPSHIQKTAFVLNVEAAYYCKYVVEFITVSRQYTIRGTTASDSLVLKLFFFFWSATPCIRFWLAQVPPSIYLHPVRFSSSCLHSNSLCLPKRHLPFMF